MAQPEENKGEGARPALSKTLSNSFQNVLQRIPTGQRRKSSEEKEPRDSVSPKGEARKHIPQGRGGAGNITDQPSPMISPDDLVTPTLKSDFYTTGRGGTGNMAKNTDPEDARRAQDVAPRPRHESATDVHVGRGGAANTVHIPAEEIEVTNRDKRKLEPTVTRVSQTNTQDESTVSNADKAVNWIKGKLNLNKGNKPAAA